MAKALPEAEIYGGDDRVDALTHKVHGGDSFMVKTQKNHLILIFRISSDLCKSKSTLLLATQKVMYSTKFSIQNNQTSHTPFSPETLSLSAAAGDSLKEHPKKCITLLSKYLQNFLKTLLSIVATNIPKRTWNSPRL